MTLLLIAALGVTMVIWGEPVDETAGDTRPEPSPLADLRREPLDAPTQVPMQTDPEPIPEAERPAVATPPREEARPVWEVTGSRVNLRAGPSTADPVVGQVREGQEAVVLSEAPAGWSRIRVLDSGQEAYIFGRFLALRGG